jgi:hypothetical protein
MAMDPRALAAYQQNLRASGASPEDIQRMMAEYATRAQAVPSAPSAPTAPRPNIPPGVSTPPPLGMPDEVANQKAASYMGPPQTAGDPRAAALRQPGPVAPQAPSTPSPAASGGPMQGPPPGGNMQGPPIAGNPAEFNAAYGGMTDEQINDLRFRRQNMLEMATEDGPQSRRFGRGNWSTAAHPLEHVASALRKGLAGREYRKLGTGGRTGEAGGEIGGGMADRREAAKAAAMLRARTGEY